MTSLERRPSPDRKPFLMNTTNELADRATEGTSHGIIPDSLSHLEVDERDLKDIAKLADGIFGEVSFILLKFDNLWKNEVLS